MGDTITTGGGIHNIGPANSHFNRSPWRAKDDTGWPTLKIETPAGVAFCLQRLGLPPTRNPRPLTFKVEPAAAEEIIRGWDTRVQTGDERLMEVMQRRPCPVYLRRGCNQILLHTARDKP